jgi:hypothetical protein
MADAEALSSFLHSVPSLQEVYLSGGEPFEHLGLEGLAATALAHARQVVIYTSGVTLSASGMEPLDEARLGRLANMGVCRVDISIYSSQRELHDGVTATPGSLQMALESARRVRRAGLGLGVHFVPLGPVAACLPQVAGLALEMMASRLHLLAPTAQGRASALPTIPLNPTFLEEVRRLQHADLPYELVLSSGVRAALGDASSNARDHWRPGFLDVLGFLYPGEGLRLPALRSRASTLEHRRSATEP